MIDIIPGRLFHEKDIQLIESGPYRNAGKPCFAILISLYGREKPVIAIYDSEIEMGSAISAIRKAWSESAGPDKSIAEEIRVMQERLDETERRLEEWRNLQQQETASGKKAFSRKKPAKKKEGRKLSLEEAKTRVDASDISEEARETLKTWVQYKYEMNQPYKETGFKSLITKMKNSVLQYGQASVTDLIEDCMANRYQGIIWERLKKGTQKENQIKNQPKNRSENQFTRGVKSNEYDFDALEEELLANSPLAT